MPSNEDPRRHRTNGDPPGPNHNESPPDQAVADALRVLAEGAKAFGGPTGHVVAARLAAASERYDQASAPRVGPAVVACVGRTKAGKSTLRYALTGAGEEGIGRGGQRTTRDVVTYAWRDLLILDTPGVGAFEGENDSELAVAAATGADVVLWLVGSDGVQLDTAAAVRRMLAGGVPSIVVVNHKQVHGDAGAQRSEEQLFPDRVQRQRRLANLLGAVDLDVTHVQLDIARTGRSTGDEAALARSGLRELEDRIASTAADGRQRRIQVARGRCSELLRGVLVDAEQAAADVGSALSDAERDLQRLQGEVAEAPDRFRAALERGLKGAQDHALAALTQAARHANTEEHRGRATVALTSTVTFVVAGFDSYLAKVLEGALGTEQEAFGTDASAVGSVTTEKVEITLCGDPLNARLWSPLRRIAGWGAGAALTATSIVDGPLGLAAGVAAGEAINRLGPSLKSERAKRTISVEKVIAQQRAELAASSEALLDGALRSHHELLEKARLRLLASATRIEALTQARKEVEDARDYVQGVIGA
jgi:hypothetical protein